jgi:hypothetical protein
MVLAANEKPREVGAGLSVLNLKEQVRGWGTTAPTVTATRIRVSGSGI